MTEDLSGYLAIITGVIGVGILDGWVNVVVGIFTAGLIIFKMIDYLRKWRREDRENNPKKQTTSGHSTTTIITT